MAQDHGLRVNGVLGVLRRSREARLMPAVRPVLDELIARGRYRISDQLYREAVRLVGE